uniref:Uncharacterized protein n=1 Tax=Anopheles dirus TaxID=7168 RepID=A0A182NGW0_9DIPT
MSSSIQITADDKPATGLITPTKTPVPPPPVSSIPSSPSHLQLPSPIITRRTRTASTSRKTTMDAAVSHPIAAMGSSKVRRTSAMEDGLIEPRHRSSPLDGGNIEKRLVAFNSTGFG